MDAPGLTEEARALLGHWFEGCDPGSPVPDEVVHRWFKKDAAHDADLRARFGQLLKQAAAGQLDGWASSGWGRLGLILVIDQLGRNLNRGSAAAFENDHRAVDLCLDGRRLGQDRGLPAYARAFFYMPLMHSERLAVQDQSIQAFEGLVADSPACHRQGSEMNLNYARQHRNIIVRFGRYPHRNEALGRDTTPEEAEFLAQPGSSF